MIKSRALSLLVLVVVAALTPGAGYSDPSPRPSGLPPIEELTLTRQARFQAFMQAARKALDDKWHNFRANKLAFAIGLGLKATPLEYREEKSIESARLSDWELAQRPLSQGEVAQLFDLALEEQKKRAEATRWLKETIPTTSPDPESYARIQVNVPSDVEPRVAAWWMAQWLKDKAISLDAVKLETYLKNSFQAWKGWVGENQPLYPDPLQLEILVRLYGDRAKSCQGLLGLYSQPGGVDVATLDRTADCAKFLFQLNLIPSETRDEIVQRMNVQKEELQKTRQHQSVKCFTTNGEVLIDPVLQPLWDSLHLENESVREVEKRLVKIFNEKCEKELLANASYVPQSSAIVERARKGLPNEATDAQVRTETILTMLYRQQFWERAVSDCERLGSLTPEEKVTAKSALDEYQSIAGNCRRIVREMKSLGYRFPFAAQNDSPCRPGPPEKK